MLASGYVSSTSFMTTLFFVVSTTGPIHNNTGSGHSAFLVNLKDQLANSSPRIGHRRQQEQLDSLAKEHPLQSRGRITTEIYVPQPTRQIIPVPAAVWAP